VLLGAGNRRPLTSAGLIAIGLLVFVWSARVDLRVTKGYQVKCAAVGSAILLTGVAAPPFGVFPPSLGSVRPFLVGLGLLTCVMAFFFGDAELGRRTVAASSFLLALLTVGAVVGYEWNPSVAPDVYHAHKLAGTALLDGQNPYTDAVSFEDGNPYATSGRVVEGYPYTPVVLFSYGLVSGLTDPRLVSLAAWSLFLGWFAFTAFRSRSTVKSEASVALLMLLAFSPLGSEVVFMAWTEPLSLLLFLGAALAWRRAPLGSGLLLGLALASKQYFVFLAPLLLLHRDQDWQKRTLTALLTAAGSVLIGLVPGPGAYVQATLGNLAGIAFRPDTQSLPGLAADLGFELLLPNPIWIGVALLVLFLLARTSRTASGFILRAALGLCAAFMIGLAFPNYWVLIAGLLALGTVLSVDEPPEDLFMRQRAA
jgi:hypothetical protein